MAEAGTQNESKRRGRPRIVPEFIEPISEGAIKHIPMRQLDLQDTSFMFRASLRVGDLAKSIKEHGQQLPIVVRKAEKGNKQYQIISGFRRSTAISQLGWDTIAVIERQDLDDDEEAFKASVLENSARKTYSDIDRAYVIKSYEDRGYSSVEVADLMGLAKRQKNNLKALLKLPASVQKEIDNPETHFRATHALLLKQMKGTYPKLDYKKWISVTNEQTLSVAQLKRRVNEEYREKNEVGFTGLFNAASTDFKRKVVHFKPVKVELKKLSEEERGFLREELEQLIQALG